MIRKLLFYFEKWTGVAPSQKRIKLSTVCMVCLITFKKKKNGREQEFFLKHSKMCKKHKPLKQHRDMSKSCKQLTVYACIYVCLCVVAGGGLG